MRDLKSIRYEYIRPRHHCFAQGVLRLLDNAHAAESFSRLPFLRQTLVQPFDRWPEPDTGASIRTCVGIYVHARSDV